MPETLIAARIVDARRGRAPFVTGQTDGRGRGRTDARQE